MQQTFSRRVRELGLCEVTGDMTSVIGPDWNYLGHMHEMTFRTIFRACSSSNTVAKTLNSNLTKSVRFRTVNCIKFEHRVACRRRCIVTQNVRMDILRASIKALTRR